MRAGNVISEVALDVQFHAKPGMTINEARENYLRDHEKAFPEFRGAAILDFGDNKQPTLLVARERTTVCDYEVIPELTSMTFEQVMQHMAKQGFEVIGEGARSPAGHRSVRVRETEKG